MNEEPQYSRGVVLAAGAWIATALLLVMAWMAWALGDPANVHLAILIAETACVASAIAVVLHLRCYAAQICLLIRVTNGLRRPSDGGTDADVREFSPRDR